MSASKLDDITEAVLARIRAISVAGGYTFNAGTVGDDSADADEASTLPAAFVARVSQSDRRMALATDGPRGREAEAVIELRLYVASSSAVRQQLRLWARDVVKAVEGTPITLGLSYVINVIQKNWEPEAALEGMTKPYGRGLMAIAVTYRMARGEM